MWDGKAGGKMQKSRRNSRLSNGLVMQEMDGLVVEALVMKNGMCRRQVQGKSKVCRGLVDNRDVALIKEPETDTLKIA